MTERMELGRSSEVERAEAVRRAEVVQPGYATLAGTEHRSEQVGTAPNEKIGKGTECWNWFCLNCCDYDRSGVAEPLG